MYIFHLYAVNRMRLQHKNSATFVKLYPDEVLCVSCSAIVVKSPGVALIFFIITYLQTLLLHDKVVNPGYIIFFYN